MVIKTPGKKFLKMNKNQNLQENEISKRLAKAYDMAQKLLEKRNLKITSKIIKTETILKFKINNKSLDKMIIVTDKLIVYWILGKISPKDLSYFVEDMGKRKLENAIIVFENDKSASSYAKKSIELLKRIYTHKIIEMFTLQELQFNPTEHKDVPNHEICSKTEKNDIIANYGEPKFLPKIFSTDIQVRWLGAKKGDMIKITRDSETVIGHNSLFYRTVV